MKKCYAAKPAETSEYAKVICAASVNEDKPLHHQNAGLKEGESKGRKGLALCQLTGQLFFEFLLDSFSEVFLHVFSITQCLKSMYGPGTLTMAAVWMKMEMETSLTITPAYEHPLKQVSYSSKYLALSFYLVGWGKYWFGFPFSWVTDVAPGAPTWGNLYVHNCHGQDAWAQMDLSRIDGFSLKLQMHCCKVSRNRRSQQKLHMDHRLIDLDIIDTKLVSAFVAKVL